MVVLYTMALFGSTQLLTDYVLTQMFRKLKMQGKCVTPKGRSPRKQDEVWILKLFP